MRKEEVMEPSSEYPMLDARDKVGLLSVASPDDEASEM